MKKQFRYHKQKRFWVRRQKKIERRRAKRKNRHYRFQSKQVLNSSLSTIAAWAKVRKRFVETHYGPRQYSADPVRVEIPEQVGLENDLTTYLDLSEKIIDLEAKSLFLDMSKCNFIWPSAITTLCSLKHWFDLTRNRGTKLPQVSSSRSNNEAVNSYLAHCGFYDYVMRPKDAAKVEFDDTKVVKIAREPSALNIKPRILGIKTLLRQYSLLSVEELEDFGCNVLPEVFLNVTEHGINYRDAGWYTLTQYRPTTGVISICIADNGIGIKHSLLTGPQQKDLNSRFPRGQSNDGDLIVEAMKENISGAWGASRKTEGLIFKKYERGKRRGLGMARIKDCCDRLNIPFTLVSGCGAIRLVNGQLDVFNRKSRVFAGTMYHFLINARKEAKTA